VWGATEHVRHVPTSSNRSQLAVRNRGTYMQPTPQAPQLPTLPQHATTEQRQQREFQLTLARTNYNYMRSYLEAVPMSADLPPGEGFSLDFEAQVIKVFVPLGENFKAAVMMLLERELASDLPTQAIEDVRAAYDKLQKEFSLL